MISTPTGLTQTAITALKKAYDSCSDSSAKEAVASAVRAITQLHLDLEQYLTDGATDNLELDPSEYCTAV
jgi:hypothetical protein